MFLFCWYNCKEKYTVWITFSGVFQAATELKLHNVPIKKEN